MKCECGHSYLRGSACSNVIWHTALQFAEDAADLVIEDMAQSYRLFGREHMAQRLRRAVVRQVHPIIIDVFDGVEAAKQRK